ncbi:hypothetical protein CLPU_2c02050 [Gottschalkia purinilytica]|uniref:Uncharacterized protein n=1 Tax=Gottschalkia purinilytica TaxID=1503 RepID=A0A0L0WE48_GOTPU|nr:DUF6042 family protein [Gottschalkia purinilytica]KNF09753.1 hypothetical protein CLPU_2c02050 [Gottschalkia purinilytica]
MDDQKSVTIPIEINDYLWTRYMPETTYKVYILIGYLNEQNIVGEEATKTILDADIEEKNTIDKVLEQKKEVLGKLGLKYPENRQDDLDLLVNFKLINIDKDDEGNTVYKYNIPVERPEEVLELDEEELKVLEDIKFELKHESALNMILTLIINNNNNLLCSVDHISKTTRVKIAEIREVMDYLVNKEGSIKIKSDKPISKLKKNDKIYISVNEEVFEKKRLVL